MSRRVNVVFRVVEVLYANNLHVLQQEEATVKVEESPSAAMGLALSAASTPQSSSMVAEGPSGSDSKKKSNRCLTCRKKVGLTGKNLLIYNFRLPSEF